MSSSVVPQQVVFIDSNVPDLQDLLNGLAPGVEAFVLDPASDGLAQIAAVLAANDLTDLSSISIVGHGAAGEIQVGSTTLDADDLSSESDALSQIGAALAAGGDLQLLSCNTASGTTGQQFIADLSQYVGAADVAAATHLVGAADGGGSWTLDASTDPNAIPAGAPFTTAALADFQGELGATPFDNDQPSLGLSQLVLLTGVYPARGGTIADAQADSGGIPLGSIRTFAGDFAWGGTAEASGQLLPIDQNTALFSLLGTTYGGNGTQTFALPNLQGAVAVGTGTGSNVLGAQFGADSATLTSQNIPLGGGGVPFNNDQPSLQITDLINTGGQLPGALSTDMLGEIVPFLGNFAPDGYLVADGQLLNISDFPGLFDVIGTTYGGDGITTFALPNLTGRTIIGTGNNTPNGTDYTLGETDGQDNTTISVSNLPGPGHAAVPLSDYQPSVALNYIIAIYGVYPSRDGGAPVTGQPDVGEIVAFAGSTIPNGWMLCNGQTLSIQQNTALFSLLGTSYGGNGVNTFDLPNLDGRSIAGVGTDADGQTVQIGEPYGVPSITLSADNVAAPTLSNTGNTAQYYESGSPTKIDSNIGLVDPATGIDKAVVTINNFVAGDTLNFTSQNGISAESNSGGVLTLTGIASASAYETALASITYSFSGDPTKAGVDKTRTVTWSVTDTNNQTSLTGGTTLDVYMTPEVSGTPATIPLVTASSGAVAADPDLTITDDNTLGSAPVATVTISSPQSGDALSISNTVVSGTGITVANTGTSLSLTGNATTTLTDFQNALDNVEFDSSSADGGTRALTWSFNDDAGGNANDSTTTPNGAPTPLTTSVDVAGTPTLTTTPSPDSVTLSNAAVTLTDAVVLSGGSNPTGTLSFTLIGPGGTSVDTETVAANGDNTYSTTRGYTLPITGTVIGIYQWNASYGGDSNNNPVSEIGNPAEQVVVSAAAPTLTTTAGSAAVTLGTTAPTLTDTADLTGGYNETGSITFTLFDGSTKVDTEMVSVTGNGNYTTPTGYTLPTTGTQTGTYQWNATYSGDSNNNAVSDNNASDEQVMVSNASPTLATTPGSTAVTLGTTAPTLTDTADLTGGYNETGSITFTLFDGSTKVDTEMVSVTGNGNYTTPTGYTLPTTGTQTGTYQWNATYSGDSNNNAVSDNNASDEQVMVSNASPTLATTPGSAAVTLGTTAPTLTDTADLTGGYNETGTITFTLFDGNTKVDAEMVSVTGNGNYTTPTGYTLPTTGTQTGTYQWNATYSGDSNNNAVSDNNASDEQVMVSNASPTLATTPGSAAVTLGTTAPTLADTADLTGGYNETGTITFTLFDGSTKVDTEMVSVTGNGNYTTPTGYTLPTTGTQTGTYQWDASYSGDSNNNAVSDNNASDEQVMVSNASPTLATTPSSTAVTLGMTAPTLTDTAVLSGGYNETGSITFTLLNPSGASVDTETVNVSGIGTYSTPTGYTLPTTGTQTGTYQWNATYSGDNNNNAVSDNNAAAEQVVVGNASPTLTTTPGAAAVTLGTTAPTLTDTAVLSGGYNETGTITYTLYYDGGTTAVDTETVNVSGNGSYSTPTGYTLPTTGTQTGTYQWNATYSGDSNNNTVSDNNAAAEQVVVSNASPTLATTPGAAAVTLGTTAPTLTDTAVLSGGYNETGTITYTLVNPSGTTVDTETVNVTGNGSYSTPTGYTLPTTGTQTGTYQWDATYTGDGNNNAVGEIGNAAEQVVVGNASPTLATTPSSTAVTLGTTAPTLTDKAALSGGYNETGSITFTLINPLGTTVDTETVNVTGNGSYSTPTGYTLPTTGTQTGTYQWDATYTGDSNNNAVGEIGNTAEQVVVGNASPTLATTPSAAAVTLGTTAPTLTDKAALSGGYNETGSITFTLLNPSGTTVDTETVNVTGNGSYSTPTGYTLPTTGTQTGTYQWDATYTGDSNNNTVSEIGNTAEQVTVGAASPTLTTSASPDVTISNAPVTLSDHATLTGGFDPTGTITFSLTAPGGATLDTETVAVSGNGTYATPTGETLFSSGTVPGTYSWAVTYSGDGNDNPETASPEQTTVAVAPLSVTHDVLVFEGGSTGTESAGDSDPDGDGVTVTAVDGSGGNVGAAVSGSYGTLTLNANDTFSYAANNLTAINAAPAGTTPTDTFTYTVSDGHGGTATETLNIAINRAGTQNNFGGNGFSGVLWRQSGSNELQEWAMNGAAVSTSAAPTSQGAPVTPDSTWNVIGTGDLGGNGRTDILWQAANGGVEDWSMNGSQITSSHWLTSQGQIVKPDPTWSMLGTGDFTGNGTDDLLWRQSTTGTLAVWLMNGSSILSGNAVTQQGGVVKPDSTWSVAALGDFSGDGSTDIVWRQSTTGDLAEWQMNGSTVTSAPTITNQGAAVKPDSSWSVVGVGDFSGNGTDDLLWRQSTTGTLAMWLMNGATVATSAPVTYQGKAVTPDSTWSIVEIGDFNGGGDSEVLWRQSTTGLLNEWQMNGAQIVSTQELTSQGAPVLPNSTWQTQAKPTDFA